MTQEVIKAYRALRFSRERRSIRGCTGWDQYGEELPRCIGSACANDDRIRQRGGGRLEDADQPGDANAPESEMEGKEIAATVNRAMDALPKDLRTAITLREIEGLSYEEIASVMNCPVGTVRSRIFRARDAIAAELRPLLGTDKDRRW